MPTIKQRILNTVTATFFFTIFGLFGGYLVAREISIHLALVQLDRYADQLIADGEASSAELRTALAAVDASGYSPCSTAELRYFSALIFESDFLKDAGRMRDGKVECSAALGKVDRKEREATPEFTQQDGTAIYTDLGAYRSSNLTLVTEQLGNSFVVFTPLTRMHLEPVPMHYVETLIDAPSQKHGRFLGELPPVDLAMLSNEGVVRQGERLFATHCSIRFFDCVTAFTSVPEVIHAQRQGFDGCVLFCGLAGGLAGMTFALLYRRNKSLEQQLRRAVRQDRLKMVYQPIVELATGRIVGAEALARWNNEDGLPVPPDVFIKIAEERGFVGEITRLAVSQVLRDFGPLLRDPSVFRVAINVAAADLRDPGFLAMLDHSLDRAGVPAACVVIEITEGSTVRHTEAIDAIHNLRRRGHPVHIDDFGTGYSSLAYLQDLCVDAIKIDRAFTQAIGTGAVKLVILPQILAMAEALSLAVVVEGVETEQQASYFASVAAPMLAQGWLFGRPAPAPDFRRLLALSAGHVQDAAEISVINAA